MRPCCSPALFRCVPRRDRRLRSPSSIADVPMCACWDGSRRWTRLYAYYGRGSGLVYMYVCCVRRSDSQGPARARHYLVPGRPRLVVRLATMVGSGNALTDCQLLWLVVEVVRSSCTAGTLVPGYHGTNLMADACRKISTIYMYAACKAYRQHVCRNCTTVTSFIFTFFVCTEPRRQPLARLVTSSCYAQGL